MSGIGLGLSARIPRIRSFSFATVLAATTIAGGADAGPVAASTISPNTCAAMVQNWEKSYSYAEVTRCKPWRRSHADALWSVLHRCQARTHQAVGECGDELNAYTSFLTASTTLENPVFGFSPRKAYEAPPPTKPEQDRAALEKQDDERRAAKRKAIIDTFGQGQFIPATTQDH